MAKEPIEFFDTDFLDNKIEIGDKVIFEAPKYRDFVIGTVVTKAPKSCQIEYINNWNYSNGRKEIVRQYYGQIIKYPIREGKWIKAQCSEKDGDANCSACGHWDWSDCNYCSNCGAKMDR